MRITKIICDRCNKEIDAPALETDALEKHIELCFDCSVKYKKLIKSFFLTDAEINELIPEKHEEPKNPSKPEKKKGGRKKYDWNEIHLLRESGESWDVIASKFDTKGSTLATCYCIYKKRNPGCFDKVEMEKNNPKSRAVTISEIADYFPTEEELNEFDSTPIIKTTSTRGNYLPIEKRPTNYSMDLRAYKNDHSEEAMKAKAHFNQKPYWWLEKGENNGSANEHT